MTGRWLCPWTPAPMSAARGARPVTRGANRAIATPETAAVRSAVIGPPSMIATGRPVVASLSTTTALIAGRPRARLAAPNPMTHLTPSRSSEPSPEAPRRNAGIAWANDPSTRGWTPILGGRSASATRAVIVRSASASRSSIGGIAARTSAADR